MGASSTERDLTCGNADNMQTGIMHKRHDMHNDTIAGVQELLVYGIKGLAAYAHHAERLGRSDPIVYAFVHKALAFLASEECDDAEKVLEMCMEAGQVNFRVMQLLDEGHTARCAHLPGCFGGVLPIVSR
jgi:hydroxylamine reductase